MGSDGQEWGTGNEEGFRMTQEWQENREVIKNEVKKKNEVNIKTTEFFFLKPNTLFPHNKRKKLPNTFNNTINEVMKSVIYYSKPQKVTRLNVLNISTHGFSKLPLVLEKPAWKSMHTEWITEHLLRLRCPTIAYSWQAGAGFEVIHWNTDTVLPWAPAAGSKGHGGGIPTVWEVWEVNTRMLSSH